jgi:hypothetical protein
VGCVLTFLGMVVGTCFFRGSSTYCYYYYCYCTVLAGSLFLPFYLSISLVLPFFPWSFDRSGRLKHGLFNHESSNAIRKKGPVTP